MGERVCLGMSGGVDSALAAALLVEQGHDVRAVYMRNWSRDLPGFRCTWADDLADAERVAVTLGLDLEVWDCERTYKETVVDYLVDAYAHGYTPNPDVMCNQTVKFGAFAERAFAEGADFVATGHYARVGVAPPAETAPSQPLATVSSASVLAPSASVPAPSASVPAPSRRATLLRAADEHKDQTYFLWRVPTGTLARTIFPVGDIPSKGEVRRMCAARGLGVERKPDSDGICFIGEVGIRSFLLDVLDRRPGDIVEWETGTVLGRHDGAFLFTVGQRKGLDLGGGPARYVVTTDTESNVVYVTADRSCPALWCRRLELSDVLWIAGVPPAEGDYVVRTRHTGELRPAHVMPHADGTVSVDLAKPMRAVAPGQSAVIYDGLVCLGGGIIQKGPLPS
ncbi:tRNA 2-thiouridine(34) synthase MnmA [Olsenella uli]|uniref:MnmA/TRMU family protein n=1 Tax=Olsenella uli TaxID=133926 RepID=UPI0028D67F7E|nr:tRNA 2-thiouridine(34) synthase MnmA [Olsenella uli]